MTTTETVVIGTAYLAFLGAVAVVLWWLVD